MSQAVLRIEVLPAGALDAAAVFHAGWRAEAQSLLAGGDALVIVMPPAAYDHSDWRRAAARDLARAVAPKRANVVAGDDERAIDASLAYLASAPGVTGQYLPLDGYRAGDELG